MIIKIILVFIPYKFFLKIKNKIHKVEITVFGSFLVRNEKKRWLKCLIAQNVVATYIMIRDLNAMPVKVVGCLSRIENS